MTKTELALLITAYNQTRQAFRDMGNDLRRMQDETKAFAKEGKNLEASILASSAAMGLAFKGMAASLTGAVVAVVELGERGSKVANVEASFRSLTASVNESADAMLKQSRTATKGLISDFDLMATANKGLLLGLPVTATSLASLGRASVALGQAMNQGAKKSMDDLILGLSRGSARILDNIGIVVRTQDAYATYARSINKSTDALTQAEKATAVYKAAIQAADANVDKLGGIHLNFAERVQQAKVAMENFIDQLGKAIATNPQLAAGMRMVAEAMQGAFGANQASTIQTLSSMVGRFGIVVTTVAQAVIEAGRFIGNVWYGLNAVFNAALSTVSSVAGSVVSALATVVEIEAKLGLASRESAQEARNLADNLQAYAFASQKATEDTMKKQDQFNATLDQASGFLGNMRKAMEDAGKAGPAMAQAVVPAVKQTADAAGMSAKELEKAAKAAHKWELTMLDALKAGQQFTAHQMSMVDAAMARKLFEQAEKWQEHVTATEVAYRNLRDAEVAATKDAADRARRMAEETAQAVQGVRQLADAFTSMGNVAGDAIGGLLNILANLNDETLRSANLWQKLGGIAQTAIGILKGPSSGSTGKDMLGGAMAGASAGAAFGPWGAAIGAVAGGILGIFKSDPVKKAQKEASQVFGRTISREMAEQIMNEAKKTGQSVAQVAKQYREQEVKEAIKQREEIVRQGIDAALGGAQMWVGKLQGAAEAQGRIFGTTFWAAVKEKGLLGAVDSMKGSFEKLREQFPDLVAPLAGLFDKLSEDTPFRAAAEAAQGLAQNLSGIAAAGYLNVQGFADFQAAAKAAFDQALAGGATNAEAIQSQLPLLANLKALSERYGYVLDTNTQSLIDQAEAAGYAFPTDPMLAMLDVLKEIAKVLGADIPESAARARNAVENIPPPPNPNNYASTGEEYGPTPPAMKYGGIINAARGVVVPWRPRTGSLVRMGEGTGPEVAAPLAAVFQQAKDVALAAAGAGGGAPIHVHVEVGGREIQEFVVDTAGRAMLRGGRLATNMDQAMRQRGYRRG